jgi:hypothetical protein
LPGTLFGREQRPEFVGHPKPSPSFAFPARGAEALVATAVSAGAGRVFTPLLNVSAITPLGTCLPIHCWRPTSHRWVIKADVTRSAVMSALTLNRHSTQKPDSR